MNGARGCARLAVGGVPGPQAEQLDLCGEESEALAAGM